jgi:hypothetical protein
MEGASRNFPFQSHLPLPTPAGVGTTPACAALSYEGEQTAYAAEGGVPVLHQEINPWRLSWNLPMLRHPLIHRKLLHNQHAHHKVLRLQLGHHKGLMEVNSLLQLQQIMHFSYVFSLCIDRQHIASMDWLGFLDSFMADDWTDSISRASVQLNSFVYLSTRKWFLTATVCEDRFF